MKKNTLKIFTLTLLLSTFACSNNRAVPSAQTTPEIKKVNLNNKEETWKIPNSPKAEEIPERKIIHNKEYLDNYSWLENKENPKVKHYLEIENTYAENVMKNKDDLQKQLYYEMSKRYAVDETSEPQKQGNYYYYVKHEVGNQYPSYYRKKGSLKAKEELLLDLNEVAKDNPFLAIKAFKVSPTNDYIAYSLDRVGDENYTIFIKDLNSKELLKEELKYTSGEIEWTNDGKAIFYCTINSAHRSERLYKHKLYNGTSNDILVFQEKDPTFKLNFYKTSSDSYIVLNVNNNDTSELHYLGSRDTKHSLKLFKPRKQGVKYYLEHNGGKFYLLTNANAKNFKLMSVNLLEQYSKDTWEELIKNDPKIKLLSMQMFKKYLVVFLRKEGLDKVRIIDLKTKKSKYLAFNEINSVIKPLAEQSFNSKYLYFSYSSLKISKKTYQYDMSKNLLELYNSDSIPSYISENYMSEQVMAKTHDGLTLPISLVYKKGLPKTASPMLLEVPDNDSKFIFSKEHLSLIDRGFVYAIPHIRGSSELGNEGLEEGKGLKKRNAFYDFLSATEYLINNNYTNSDKLAIAGKGFGGLVVNTVATMKPELFKTVVSELPNVDVTNAMFDSKNIYTLYNYNELGNPEDKKVFDYQMSYSPYENLTNTNYPNMLILSAFNNVRVNFWEQSKFVAKMRKLKKDKKLLLLKTELNNANLLEEGRYAKLSKEALKDAFILTTLAVDK